MGRPYNRELKELASTYNWAIGEDISTIKRALKASADLPMIAIGSGGSLSVAQEAARAHTAWYSRVSRAVTPLELPAVLPKDRNVSVWLFSAGGRNIDVQRAFRHSVLSEPRQLNLLCLDSSSPVSRIAEKYHWVEKLVFDPVVPRDGFLATNSLLAFFLLIARAYTEVNGGGVAFPSSLRGMLARTNSKLSSLEKLFGKLSSKSTFVVLHGNTTQSVATDLESRCTEAALGSVQVADFRNFAHGRHHWLAKHSDTSAVIAFYEHADRALATQTLATLPSQVSLLPVELNGTGFEVAISGLIISMNIAGWIGQAKNIKPGGPGVPLFGRKLYNLRSSQTHVVRKTRDIAVLERKAATKYCGEPLDRSASKLLSDMRAFRSRLRRARFSILVADYDGTLVDTRYKTEPPNPKIVQELIRLLEGGIILGIATGRGDSVREDLRSFLPNKWWKRVWVGYYNCAQIGRLDDDTAPHPSKSPRSELERVYERLQEMEKTGVFERVRAGKDQISIIPGPLIAPSKALEFAQQAVLEDGREDIVFLRSGHSVDIVHRSTSKLNLVAHLCNTLKRPGNVLTMGDRGKWPGNDFELLSTEYSLSVDEVSSANSNCWNFAPPGVRGPQAAQFYLAKLEPAQREDEMGLFRLKGI